MNRRRTLLADLDAAARAEILALYVENRWTVEDVAGELGISANMVATVLRSLGEPSHADDTMHNHAWEAAPDLGFRRYRCACGRTGHRNGKQEIVPERVGLRRRAWLLARSDAGAVPKTPNLDDYDRGGDG